MIRVTRLRSPKVAFFYEVSENDPVILCSPRPGRCGFLTAPDSLGNYRINKLAFIQKRPMELTVFSA